MHLVGKGLGISPRITTYAFGTSVRRDQPRLRAFTFCLEIASFIDFKDLIGCYERLCLLRR